MTDLTLKSASGIVLPAELHEYAEAANEFARASLSDASRRSYASACRAFVRWCDEHGFDPLPADPKVVILFISKIAKTLSVSSVTRYSAAIGAAHRESGFPSPTEDPDFRRVLKGIRRKKGTAPGRKATGIRLVHLRAVAAALGDSPCELRDLVLVTAGWALAARRSELAALRWGHIEFRDEGVRVFIAESKGDQERKGTYLGLPRYENEMICPVQALERWREHLGDPAPESPVLRRMVGGAASEHPLSGRGVSRAVKRTGGLIGTSPEDLSGHSLRRGWISEAVRLGVPEFQVARHARHKSVQTTHAYFEEEGVFQGNALGIMGL